MSVLSSQADELREKARLLRAHAEGLSAPYVIPSTKELMALTMLDSASRMEEAADTIESLRDRLQERQHDHPYVGLVRGKYRETLENSDYYCGRCQYPVTDHDSYCRECGGALHESYGQAPEQRKRDDSGEVCGEVCGDDRFELIGKAKAKLLEATNIEMRPDEMAVLDSVLFRCWQMGWLDKLRDDDSRYSELFGTPERAAETMFTLMLNCARGDGPCERCPAFPRCNWVGDDGEEPESMMLEWLRGDAE